MMSMKEGGELHQRHNSWHNLVQLDQPMLVQNGENRGRSEEVNLVGLVDKQERYIRQLEEEND